MIHRSFLAGAVLAALAGTAQAQGLCQDLWFERNSIYKRAGYCFKTARAIAAFGNAGCQYDNEADLSLSANDRRRVQFLIREERANACR